MEPPPPPPNPPFVASAKKNRRYFIETLILEAHKLLRPDGALIFVQSSMANIPRSMEQLEESGMSVRILGETSGAFRPYYFEDTEFMSEIAALPGAYTMIDGEHHERLVVFEGRLH